MPAIPSPAASEAPTRLCRRLAISIALILGDAIVPILPGETTLNAAGTLAAPLDE